MTKHRQALQNLLLYAVFVLYLFILFKILIYSRNEYRSINVVPFQSVMDYILTSDAVVHSFGFINIVGNIILFIPLGVYLCLFKYDKRIGTNVLWILIISILVEITQYILGIGASDIDDVILNSLGGLLGAAAYRALSVIFKAENKVRVIIIITSIIVALPVTYFLFKLKIQL